MSNIEKTMNKEAETARQIYVPSHVFLNLLH